ncbi:hypothetical protein GUJ93_ZPchr0003g17070 [Zizania palustris]|uniref:Uncharacterized protein n=1 Tax=Zizania palustris TaxID=103762 RepID=A0A8J5STC4_ZIZPA|nr:hypothetical protein GUJ93_ZPchr0003g17070 [Zizania palustris]
MWGEGAARAGPTVGAAAGGAAGGAVANGEKQPAGRGWPGEQWLAGPRVERRPVGSSNQQGGASRGSSGQ